MPKEIDDATLPDTLFPVEPISRVPDLGIDRRYELGPVLGRGGMGEVRLARDQRIHRDVAVKIMRTTNDETLTARFLREAQVQGALDHPAIPPVHDLGVDRDGQPYFVMKKLAGTTLGDVLAERSSSDALQAKWSRRTLLTRLVDVCLAVELAHTRGVVHRDLKPANIMLGDFGETYVLDWGLARITNDELTSVQTLSGDIEDAHTVAGALLGTPGYMAPEQARGEPIDAPADVYALGCILFEILTGVPALPRGLPAIEATLTAIEHRPSKRVDVPPELDELCARATAQESAKRPTARQLAESLQAYLDGDRDLEARRTLAAEHVTRATKLLGEPGDDARAEAMREASRALALDRSNALAQGIVASLVLEPPRIPPPAAIAQADIERDKARQQLTRWAAVTYAGVMPILCVLFLFPVHHAWPILASIGVLAVMTLLLAFAGRRLLGMRSRWYVLLLIINTLLLISCSFIFGPMLVFPIFAVGSLAGYVMAPSAFSPVFVIAAHVIAFLLPVGLELTGVTPSTFSIEHGRLVLTPWVLELTPIGATIILIVSVLAQFANTATIGLSVRRAQDRALDQVHVQSWHLQQLVPRDSK